MILTAAQYDVLRADINADPVLLNYYMTGLWADLANAYNEYVTPTWYVWKTLVTLDEIMQNGFDWTQVDNLEVGKARIWEWLFANSEKAVNPSKTNIRAGIDECWKGTAQKVAVRDAVYGHCKRSATRFEKLFSSGTGSSAVPALLTLEGFITPDIFVDM